MTDTDTLREILADGEWLLNREEPLVERDLATHMLERAKYSVIEVATGVRRAGKSKLLMWVGRHLIEGGRRVYYINFEDDRFVPDARDFQKLSSLMDLSKAVLLVDEPQNMPRWELWVRRMHDRGVKVYVTGSNSRLLGKEMATALGGRKKQHEVFPFSFSEYLRALGKEDLPSDQKVKELERYMEEGGFPYPTVSGDYSVLVDYRRDILERDILLRHDIRDDVDMRNIVRFLMSNPGLYLSHKSIKGFADISHPTLRKYLEYIAQAYAVIPLEKYGYSQREQIKSPKKFYPVDNGLLMKKDDRGRLLESVVVQHIRRLTDRIYYWKDDRGREVDIFLPEKNLAIQVVYDLTPENLKREKKGLEVAAEKIGARPLIVYLHGGGDTKYPALKATTFIEKIETTLSTFA